MKGNVIMFILFKYSLRDTLDITRRFQSRQMAVKQINSKPKINIYLFTNIVFYLLIKAFTFKTQLTQELRLINI